MAAALHPPAPALAGPAATKLDRRGLRRPAPVAPLAYRAFDTPLGKIAPAPIRIGAPSTDRFRRRAP